MPHRKRHGIDRQHSSSFPIGTRFAGLPIGESDVSARQAPQGAAAIRSPRLPLEGKAPAIAADFFREIIFVKSSQKYPEKIGANAEKRIDNPVSIL